MKTNMSKLVVKSGALTLAVGATLAGAASAQSGSRVYLNGSPLRLAVAPIQQNGRTLVPMRDIFEALGATVNYNSLNQSIAAQKGTTIVRLALGSRNAAVNNIPVTLDAAARTYYGSTFVPLRFVSEALGANVSFNPSNRIVSINASGIGSGMGGGTQVAGIRQISIPAQSVVPVTLDSDISSASAYTGQTISATVVSERLGDSEFPAGTKLEGVITEATKTSGNTPGVLDMRFRTAVLPDGTRVNLMGNPIGLDNESVSTQNGRYVAKAGARKNNSLKVIGVGAGAGFLIGKLLKKDGLLPSIIGAAGGFLYDRNKKKDQAVDARLAAGTKLGVRLNQRVSYRDTTGYYDQRSNYVKL
ncbi:Copper amine oxidase N-terminal domain-containing protein [Abditibacterium utsteinense]|uniref:Copper amine oxidase N-terminal domain-containing protein n=1 Tax=Abditibacterium utsteinense TaxID=1960156 RepID=A0A2S8SW84_9BACT|nr:copper amine oxidase N-terminal domain-containing protein [Abditibacterium utsteinense]PQV65048.1 Copper amine oxidase N-terminal domain-containing protein [Abditibacterium utsteinense]